MSKQRFACVVAACLVVALAPACAARAAKVVENCRRSVSVRDPLIYGGEMRDGVWYLRVAYDHDVDPEHRKAFEGAMAMWNAKSKTTGIKFELATSGLVDFRLQRGAPIYTEREDINVDVLATDEARIERDEDGKCAEYVSSGPYIWYSLKLLQADPQLGGMTRIYAHELGHVLNLTHKTGTSVMYEKANEMCWKLGTSLLSEIQPDDAWEAAECAWGLRRKYAAPGVTRRPYLPPSKR